MNILFICTGNTCRSPMAEGYLNSKNIDGLTAYSAGLCAFGEPISQNSYAVLMEKGIDMSGHVSCPVTSELCDAADKIICISPSHKQILISYGVDENKLLVLGDGIADPYGEDIDTYRRCRDEIFSAVDALFPNIKVRQSTLQNDDAKNIAELEADTFSEPWSEDAIRQSYQNGTLFFIAEADDDFAGYCGLNTVLDEGYITNVAVRPEHRRKGVASAILKELDYLAKLKGLAFISLEVRESNIAAQKLYAKHGYQIAGERKSFYANPRENAIIMTKRFKDEDTQH